MNNYETVVGLEIHAELSTDSKAYCSCKSEFGAEVNANCCPGCLGYPGTLPVLNKKVVDYALKIGLATNCSINKLSKQDRKNYFYPDLAKAYQDTQGDIPLCYGGRVEFLMGGERRSVRLCRIHIEEDTAKLLHDVVPDMTLIDFNRSGVPLIEIVTEPDIRSAAEAKAFLEAVKSILAALDICDCKMQEGSIRCDVNVSVRPMGQEAYGTRVEMKNISSFSGAVAAIEYESGRQLAAIAAGETLSQETRRWDDAKGVNFVMRSKESANDYRYFPEPDILPIVVDDEWIEKVRSSIPELPVARAIRYMTDYSLPADDAALLAETIDKAAFFESCAKIGGAQPKNISNWIIGDMTRILGERGVNIGDCPASPERLVEMISLIESGTISVTAAKRVLEEMMNSKKAPAVIVDELGLKQMSGEDELKNIVSEVLAQNEKSAEDYKNGKTNALGFLVGQCMKASNGKANPAILNKLLKDILDS